MKYLFIPLLILVVSLSSCGAYKTYSAGQSNESFIMVLREKQPYDNVTVIVDGKEYPVAKVYKVKSKRKSQPIVIEPGKHTVKVAVNGRIISEESVFIGLQETKKIVLR